MTAIAESDAGEQQVGQCMCVAVVVVDVRRGRVREWLLALSRQLLSLSSLNCTSLASRQTKSRCWRDFPVIKTSSGSYLIDIHFPSLLPTCIFWLKNAIGYIICTNHAVFLAIQIIEVLSPQIAG